MFSHSLGRQRSFNPRTPHPRANAFHVNGIASTAHTPSAMPQPSPPSCVNAVPANAVPANAAALSAPYYVIDNGSAVSVVNGFTGATVVGPDSSGLFRSDVPAHVTCNSGRSPW